MENGVVDTFDKAKGFGFIKLEDGKRAFVHYSVIKTDDDSFKTLEAGEQVQILSAPGVDGLVALEVIRGDK
ncbi:cold-shock protein [Pediococcus claussenii]|uniref:'Cold-shock' DNA-binding domain protein n=1 Tax=Pediococcus claussenii (strain ATCC BAA-344 / DSM 14800 / JCM 18046 / KCTC 3811 / LMG 21948 / P06) TaxID=701521 RepID=G8PCV2_PEDCP|nr:cold shock domain-containing protein [Pediococcus claussenii]AEV95087.1 'Cold-shock' DNA-binding domain protein [Pediococcus claussenii ATCC BAA-344]ANZ70275.1 cold-shock protein [Pediococcus claussenii]ANZ72091.1 cold-shock protein [Pediococcus claussenii]KRN18948.1 hypothetical protein IV79_GL001792 [Pediococcus claussenii]